MSFNTADINANPVAYHQAVLRAYPGLYPDEAAALDLKPGFSIPELYSYVTTGVRASLSKLAQTAFAAMQPLTNRSDQIIPRSALEVPAAREDRLPIFNVRIV